MRTTIVSLLAVGVMVGFGVGAFAHDATQTDEVLARYWDDVPQQAATEETAEPEEPAESLSLSEAIAATATAQAPMQQAAAMDRFLAQYDGLDQGLTADGYPVLGDTEAPAELTVWSSFACPHCMTFNLEVTGALTEEQVRAGDLSIVYVPVTGIGNVPNGDQATVAAYCAGDQDAFWPYHDYLFDRQFEDGAEAYSMENLLAGAEGLQLDMATFETCLSSAPSTAFIEQTNIEFLESGFGGTPAVLLNGSVVNDRSLGGLQVAIASLEVAQQDPTPVEDEPAESLSLGEAIAATATAGALAGGDEPAILPTVALLPTTVPADSATFAIADAIEFGEVTSVQLDGDTQAQQYAFDATAGDQVLISASSFDLDTYLLLYDSAGTLLAQDDDGGEETNSLLSFEIPETATYTVEVTTFGAQFGGSSSVGTIELILSTEQQSSDDEPPAEVVLDVDGTIGFGETATVTLSDEVPAQLYSFSATAGDTVVISANSVDLDTYLQLYDAQSNLIAEDDDSGSDVNARLTFSIPETATYIVEVTTFNALFGESGFGLSGDIDLALDFSQTEGLVLGIPIQGTLDSANPVAEYTFEGEIGDLVVISLESDDFDTYLTVLYDDFEYFYDDDSGVDLNSQIGPVEIFEPGTYTILAEGFDSDAVGDFTLTVSLVAEIAIDFGETVTVTLDENTPQQYLRFDATVGDILQLDVSADTAEDIDFSLRDSGGYDLYSDFTLDGTGSIEQLRIDYDDTYRIVLQSDGTTGTATVTLAAATVPDISSGAQSLSFDENTYEQILSFDAVEGETVMVEVLVGEGAEDISYDVSFYIDGTYIGNLSIVGATVANAEFTWPETGTGEVIVNNYSYVDTEIKLTFIPVEE